MLDLETLSTNSNAAIIAIGAVKFDGERGGEVYDKFYQAVTGVAELEGFHVKQSTLDWWAEKSEEARAVFTDQNAVDLPTALLAFYHWAIKGTKVKDIRMWGNGSDFDNVILTSAYGICNMVRPWEHWNSRCYRTIKNQNRNVPMNRTGTFHNALDDAESQANHLLAMGLTLA